MLFGVKGLLNPPLINLLLSISPFSLLTGELIIIFGLLNLVHSGSIRKVLDLPRRNPGLLLLPLNSILNRDILLDTQFLHIFMEVLDALVHIVGMLNQLLHEALLVDLDLSVLKREHPGDLLGSDLSVLLPVLLALSLPFFHESLIFLHFGESILSLALLQTFEHVHLGDIVVMRFFLEIGPGDFVLQKFFLSHDQRLVLKFESRAFNTVLGVDFWQFGGQVFHIFNFIIKGFLLEIGNCQITFCKMLV